MSTETPQTQARQLIRPLACMIAIGFIISCLDESKPEFESLNDILSNCSALKAWPLLTPFVDLYIDICDWILADTTTLDLYEGPIWDPCCTALILCVLVRCGILYGIFHFTANSTCPYLVWLFKSAWTSASNRFGTTISFCKGWISMLVTAAPLFFLLLITTARLLILLVILACQKTVLWLKWCCNMVISLGKYQEKPPIVLRTIDTGVSTASETPIFWTDLCHDLSKHCQHTREELYWAGHRARESLRQAKARYETQLDGLKAEYRSKQDGWLAKIRAADADRKQLGLNQDTLQTIATLRGELASANGAVAGLGDQVAGLRKKNAGLTAQVARERDWFDDQICRLGKDPTRVYDMVVPKSRYDGLKSSLDFAAARHDKQFERAERLSKENKAMKTELDWIRFHVPAPPKRHALRSTPGLNGIIF